MEISVVSSLGLPTVNVATVRSSDGKICEFVAAEPNPKPSQASLMISILEKGTNVLKTFKAVRYGMLTAIRNLIPSHILTLLPIAPYWLTYMATSELYNLPF